MSSHHSSRHSRDRDRSRSESSTGGTSTRGGGSSQLPAAGAGSAWSAWTWSAEYNCQARYRLNSIGEYEWQYGDVASSSTGSSSRFTPRNRDADPPPLAAIQETTQFQQQNYTTNANAPVSSLTAALAATSLGPSQPSMQNTTPPVPSSAPRRIQTRNRFVNSEKLDPRFKVHKSDKFKFGKVFKVLWSEPQGSGGTEITVRTPSKYGETAHQKIRRFVVVDNRKGHCICLPILTYGGQGTLKYGVHPEDHSVIYSSRRDGPRYLEHERISKPAIRMNPIDESEKLDPYSRLNFAKPYTVEHNVKVFFVGEIAESSQQKLVTSYNETHRPLPDVPNTGRTSPESDVRYTEGTEPQYPRGISIASALPNQTMGSASQSFQNPAIMTGGYSGSYANPVVGSYQNPTTMSPGFSSSSNQAPIIGSYGSSSSMGGNYPSSSSYQANTYFPPASTSAATPGGYYTAPSQGGYVPPATVAQTTYTAPVYAPSYSTRNTRSGSPDDEHRRRR